MASVGVHYVFRVMQILRDMGLDKDAPVFRRLSIDADAATNPKTRLPLETFHMLLDQSSQILDDPHLGLHIGERFRISTFGQLSRILGFCRDIEEATTINRRYSCLVHTIGFPRLVKSNDPNEDCDKLVWNPNFTSAKESQYRQITEYIMTNYVMTLNWLAWGFGKGVKDVSFKHQREAEHAEYERVLDCPVSFNVEQNIINLNPGILNTPLPTADHAKSSLLQSKLEKVLASYNLQSNLKQSVEQKVRELIRFQTPSFPIVSQELGLSERSLRRYLNEQNTNFAEIIKSVKMDLCNSYIEEGMSFSEIAQSLWYCDQSAFTRAFKKWHGMSPKKYRAMRE